MPYTNPIFDIDEPVKLMDDVKTFSCGANHILIVENDGTLWSWGKNNAGELGNNTLTEQQMPVEITGFYRNISN